MEEATKNGDANDLAANNGHPAPSNEGTRILYCNCSFTKVVPEEVKKDVLSRLSESGVAFDAVADLCDLSARKDPSLARIAGGGNLRIAACFPRTVKWLFHAAKTPLPETGVEVLNMRTEDADAIVPALLADTGVEEGETT